MATPLRAGPRGETTPRRVRNSSRRVGQKKEEQGATTLIIDIFYPLPAGADLVLRTHDDWDRDLVPVETLQGGTGARFEVFTTAPHVYFKPVLRLEGEERWSQGPNYLAVPAARTTWRVFPYFSPDASCSACVLRELESEAGEMHHYRVFYPPGYHENHLRRFPVLYMQDGPNLFFAGEAFQGQHWKVEETLAALTAMNLLEGALVVGIYPNDRQREYTLPGYEAYGRLLAGQIKPAVDAKYRTLPGPEHTAVMGSSLGGVVTLFTAWEHPEVFGMAACLSSTFGWRDDLRQRILAGPKPPIQVYLDSGWPDDNYETTREMRALLAGRGFREGIDLHYFAFPHAAHNEKSWALRAHLPFQLFFGTKPPVSGPRGPS